VTTDADTWFSLIVNDLLDPLTIKEAILARLNINPMEGPFEYIHENGPYPGTLFFIELIFLWDSLHLNMTNEPSICRFTLI
jgi:hypothetical protein